MIDDVGPTGCYASAEKFEGCGGRVAGGGGKGGGGGGRGCLSCSRGLWCAGRLLDGVGGGRREKGGKGNDESQLVMITEKQPRL